MPRSAKISLFFFTHFMAAIAIAYPCFSFICFNETADVGDIDGAAKIFYVIDHNWYAFELQVEPEDIGSGDTSQCC